MFLGKWIKNVFYPLRPKAEGIFGVWSNNGSHDEKVVWEEEDVNADGGSVVGPCWNKICKECWGGRVPLFTLHI